MLNSRVMSPKALLTTPARIPPRRLLKKEVKEATISPQHIELLDLGPEKEEDHEESMHVQINKPK